MIVRLVTCKVKPGMESKFEELTAKNHAGSIMEPGVLRFDVLRDDEQPGLYYLYEVYRDEAATSEHKTTDHYLTWREVVADCLATDRTSVTCSVVAPTAESDWKVE